MSHVAVGRRSTSVTTVMTALFGLALMCFAACTFSIHLPPVPVAVESDIERTRRAMAEMRSLSSSIQAYAIDFNKYPYPAIGATIAVGDEKLSPLTSIAEILVPYMKIQPLFDPWGSPYFYWTDNSLHNHGILSLGADGKLTNGELIARILGVLNDHTRAVSPASTTCFEDDLLLVNGQMVVWPQHEVKRCAREPDTHESSGLSELLIVEPTFHLPKVSHPQLSPWISPWAAMPTIPLIGGLRSGMSLQEAIATFPEETTWESVAFAHSGDRSPPVDKRVIRAHTFSDLSQGGDLDLYFANGALFACRFKPDDVVAYGQALGMFPTVGALREAEDVPKRLCFGIWQDAPGRWAFCYSDALRSTAWNMYDDSARHGLYVSPFPHDFP